MNYPTLQEQSFKENPNRLDDKVRGNETVYEAAEPEADASVSQLLDIKQLMADPITMSKVEAVDAFIHDLMEKEGVRNGNEGFRTIVQRFLGRMPLGTESMVRAGRGLDVLEFLLGEAAVTSKISKSTFLELMGQKANINNAKKTLARLNNILTSQLKKTRLN